MEQWASAAGEEQRRRQCQKQAAKWLEVARKARAKGNLNAADAAARKARAWERRA